MNKKLLRILALALVALMLMFAVACAETPDESDDSGESSSETTASSGDATSGNSSSATTGGSTTTYEQSSLPEGLNYDNEVSILYWKDVEMPEFDVPEGSVNGVENAIFKRNENTKKFLGISIAWTGFDGDHGEKEAFAQHVGNSYLVGDRTYDIIATYSRTAGLCAIEGYLADLNEVEDSYINLNKTWWPQSIIDCVTIDDSIYFLSGDISTNSLHMMYAIFCNTDMITDLGLTNPVSLALSYEWTLEAFMGLVEGVFNDLDGDGSTSAGDRYGFVTAQLHIDAFYLGSGLRFIESDEDDVLVISPDFTSQKLVTLINDLTEFRLKTDVYLSNAESIFANGNALFTQNRMYYCDRSLKNVTFKYACLPTPMYDAKQGTYSTCVGNPFTLWGIMVDVEDDMQTECSAVLECLASEAYRTTTPQIFEVNMKVKYADENNADTVKCFDLIRDGVVYDLGRIFPNNKMGGTYMNDIFSICIVKVDNWITVRQQNIFLLRTSLEEIVDAFEAQKK